MESIVIDYMKEFSPAQLRAGQNRYDTTLAASVFQQLRAAWITRCKVWLTF